MNVARRFAVPLLALALVAPSYAAQTKRTADPLLAAFRVPPSEAKPRVWWHWMNGNITKEGIKADLDWMKKIGIGGVDAIDASIETPQVVEKRLVYMTPEWKDAFLYAVKTADTLGMEFSINSSPGWSETGGPWVKPDQAMKKAVWSKTVIDGGKAFHGILPRPPGNIGPLQNAPFALDETPTPATASLDFYRDALVIAYREPAPEARVAEITSNAGSVNAAMLSDGDLAKSVTLTPAGDQDVWVRVAFKRPETIQGLTLALTVPRGIGWNTHIEASDDGKSWRAIADMPKIAELHRLALIQQTTAFAPVKARYFRIRFTPAEALANSYRPQVKPAGLISPPAATPARSYKIAELVFHAQATIQEAEKKAQFATPPLDFYTVDSPSAFAPGTAVDPASVVVLTDKMRADGTLDWTPPPGRWVVLRLGYSLTGKENHPATPEATGLEVDKLSAAHVRSYISTYLDSYAAFTGPSLFGKRGALTIDSSEVGMQNWTEDILAAFKTARGYDPVPFLPVLTGIAVKSPADSDRFLYDFRRTIAELFARSHYGVIAEVSRERGLINYAESIENNRPGFGDDMETRRFADIPMGAMWTYGDTYPITMSYEADLLGAASVAHIYGRKFVAAESLTSQYRLWAQAPRDLKSVIDLEFARGVNRVVLHTSVHQPVDRPPGLTLFSYGQFFNRLDTWSAEAGPWISYIARSSYLLQQGRFAADIAYFYGEEAPIVALFAKRRVDEVPPGYAFDFVNLDVLLNQLSVDNGELVSKSGMRYRLLYLGGSSERMTLAALNRIADFVRQGAVVVGKRPVASPSLADDPARWTAAADALFASGKVHATLSEAFAALNLAPDFSAGSAPILYNHRTLADGELYLLSSRSGQPLTADVSFRVTGKAPQIWDAVTGTVRPVAYRVENGRTALTLSLPSNGSAFVVFRKAAKPQKAIARETDKVVKDISGSWSLAFEPGRGAPARINEPALAPWNASNDPGVKYFSGEGTYLKTFTMPGKRRGARYFIDLGDVHDLAEVTLNGKPLGTVWTAPYRVDASKALKPGKNVLSVKVVNLWVNRLIGDAQPDAAKKYTFTSIPTYKADAPLRPSGLMGPVTIQRAH